MSSHYSKKKKPFKGLGKLKNYCQACQKQCGDSEGLENHCKTEAHIRRMAVFRENASDMMSEFSLTFEREYLGILRRYGSKAMDANQVYQEYIADRDHIHMNSTKWDTLSSFAQYLGQTNKCEVEYRDGKWYVTYINRDSGFLERQRKAEIAQASTRSSEALSEALLQQQMENAKRAEKEALKRGLKLGGSTADAIGTERSGIVKAGLNITTQITPAVSSNVKNIFDDGLDNDTTTTTTSTNTDNSSGVGVGLKRKSRFGTVDNEGNHDSVKRSRFATSSSPHNACVKGEWLTVAKTTNPWVREGCVVKLMNKTLNEGKFYKEKGDVISVFAFVQGTLLPLQTPENKKNTSTSNFCISQTIVSVAEVALHNGGQKIRVPFGDLETVIPSEGSWVAIVGGKYSEESDKLRKGKFVEQADGGGYVRLGKDFGDDEGKEVLIDYDHMCKIVDSKL